MTVVFAAVVYFCLPDCEFPEIDSIRATLTVHTVPDTAGWLSGKERAFVKDRLPQTAPRADELKL